jgi:hypothetical protein
VKQTAEHAILFSGHMIDAEDREEARFPESKETSVHIKIEKQLLQEIKTKKALIGLAGCACGSDILFHELCDEMNIPSEIYLALPVKEYKKHSVSFAGKKWERRFDRLIKKKSVHILSSGNADDTVWTKVNTWMLDAAQKKSEDPITLIAVWDGKEGDGEGGTAHMIRIAEKSGAEIYIITP